MPTSGLPTSRISPVNESTAYCSWSSSTKISSERCLDTQLTFSIAALEATAIEPGCPERYEVY
ncbi:hypothetical protein ACTXPP_13195, partial [Candidatus Corynebacterium faecigallinarum]|uniref:hypothetical protein n=1 Tax=Candidatus Corynebacterium faecigallinarum TaxID=2838528 RepID=UPI003FCF5BAF